jgi:hypothetical protein
MKRMAMALIGLFVGLVFAVVVMALFVERPHECGEPAACGDAYLFPVAYFALAAVAGFPALSICLGNASSWRGFYRQLALGSACVALLIMASFVVLTLVRHA